MEIEPKVVSSIIISQQGSYRLEQRWLEGHHPELGILTYGWQNEPQTIQQKEIVTPVVVVTVYERDTRESK